MATKDGTSILIIDDDEANRIIYSEYLRQNRFHVVSASDGEIALKRILEAKFDLVLLDITIPKIDGLKILETIKKDPLRQTTKVYILTTLGTDNIIQKAFEAGADGFLLKDAVTCHDVKNEIIKALT